MTHELWAGLNAHIFAYLRSVTLAQLVAAAGQAGRRRCCRIIASRRCVPARKPEPATGRLNPTE